MPQKKKSRNSPLRGDINADYLYMLVTADEFECPMMVSKTCEDMASHLGRSLDSLRSTISHGGIVKFNGARCVVKVVKVGERRKKSILILLIKAGEEPKFIRIKNTDSAISELIGGEPDYQNTIRHNVIISKNSVYEGPENRTLFGKKYTGTVIVAGIGENDELTDVKLSTGSLPLFMKLAGA